MVGFDERLDSINKKLDSLNLDKKELDKVETEIESEIEENLLLPKPPPEIEADKRLKKRYLKEAKANWASNRIQQILKIKGEIHESRTTLEEDFLYKQTIKERIYNLLFKRNFIRAIIITKDGVARAYLKPIKEEYITIKKKIYSLNKKNVIRFKGKPTLFYFENNPASMHFDSSNYRLLVNSESLYSMFQARFVKQLFAQELSPQTMAMGFMTIIGIGIAVVMIYNTVTGKDNPTSTAPIIIPFITRWFKND